MVDQDLGRGPKASNGSAQRAVYRSMAAEHDAGRGTDEAVADERDRRRASTASADSVDALRRSVRDLKHDVRMLKVVVDKQSALLEQLLGRLP